MEFRTKIDIAKLNLRIDHSSSGLTVGSCFAESIAERMSSAKFRLAKNPFGVLYNPASIALAISRLDSGASFTTDDLSSREGLWFSFSHHGSFSNSDPAAALEAMNVALENGAKALQNADYVVVTFGTAWTYRNAKSGRVVANCHKLPAAEFVRERLSAAEIVALYRPLLEGVLKSKKVLFTVSPIRHIKDGLAENSLSKATLLVAIHELTTLYNNVEYFPSYEIMIDELRDYRFYKEDMLHPTEQAVDYIWEAFRGATMDSDAEMLVQQIDRLSKAVQHRPLNPHSESHSKFRASMLSAAQKLALENPMIDFANEFNFFK